MDTVSESSMAIAIAREGGIAVLHKNMSVEEQVKQVNIVKRAESGVILDPVTIQENAIVSDAKKIMEEYGIGGIPVLCPDKKLVGIVTNRDLRFEKNNNKLISDVMTSSGLITTKKNISLAEAEVILQKNKIEKLPIIDEENNLIGLITFRDIIKVKKQPNACKDNFGRLRVAAAIGVGEKGLNRCASLVKSGVDAVVIDTAHAHSKMVIETLIELKKKFPKIDCVVGNIATAEAANLLIKNNADAIKVGIGPGSICTTRMVAGIGVPQITAIMNVKSTLGKRKIKIISDGGIKFSGDLVKALAAGADAIMMGSIFAGTEESPGQKFRIKNKFFKAYRGMGSRGAMSSGSSDRYFQKNFSDKSKFIPEGVESRVIYKGSVKKIMHQLQGGLRSSMGYIGAKKIKDIQKNAKFVKITKAGFYESMVHSVIITGSAENYKL